MLRTLFVLAILVPGLAVALTSRFAALLLYIWFALFRPQDWLWIDVSSLRLSMVLSVLVVVPWAWLASRGPSRTVRDRVANEALPNITHPISIGILLFYGLALIAQVHAVKPEVGWEWLDYLWRVLLVALVTISLVSTEQRMTAVVAVAAGSLGFHAAKAGVASLFSGGVRFGDGLSGSFGDNNGYALAVVMILFFMIAAGQNLPDKTTLQRWARRGFYVAALPSAYAVISTFSRGGFLALTACLFVFAGLQKRRVTALVALVSVVGLAYLFVPIPKGYFDRLQTIQTYDEINEESALSRLHFWQVAIRMVDANPLGVGLRNYDWAYDQYDFSGGKFGRGRSVHSSHFQVLAELGYAGAAVWGSLFLYAIFVCLRVRRRARDGRLSAESQRFYVTMANALLVSMIGFLIGGSFIALALNDLTWLTFGLVAALDRLSATAIAERVRSPSAAAIEPGAGVSAGLAPPPAFQGSYRRVLAERADPTNGRRNHPPEVMR